MVNDRASALAALRSFLEAVRAELRAKVTDGEGTETFAGLSVVPRLSAALDEYDSAVRGIQYPHLRDPQLLSVRTQMELLQAAGIAPQPAWPNAATRLKAELVEAVAADREAHEQWPRARDEARRWKPVAAFTEALRASLTPARLGEILAAVPPDAGEQQRAEAVLDVLADTERRRLWTHLHQPADGSPVAPPADVRAGILAGLGLQPDPQAAPPPDEEAARGTQSEDQR